MIILSYFTLTLAAQDSTLIDTQTENLFQQKRWKALIMIGEKALEKEVDFYELRYRLGVAHYEESHYWQSIPHFEKALEFVPNEVVSLEYLYYAYAYVGRSEDAVSLSSTFPTALKNTINQRAKRPLDWVYAEGGSKRSSNSDTVGHLNYGNLWLHQQFGQQLELTHGLNYLKTSYFNTNIQQYDYFLGSNFYTKQGFSITGNVHYQWVDGSLKSEEDSVQDFFDERDLVVHLGVTKHFNRLKIAPYGQYIQSKIILNEPQSDTTYRFYQTGLQLAYTPNFLNNKLQIQGETAANIRSDSTYFLWKIGLTYQLTKNWTISGNFHHIGITNFTENNGVFYTNTLDKTDYKLSILSNYQITPKISWYASYQYEPKTAPTFNYQYNTFLTGIKIKL